MPAAQKAHGSNKFRADKATSGDVTLLTLHGVLAEGFEGRKLAESVRTKKILVSLYEVRRFASWGMSEWMDFLRVTADKDLYLVECSTYAVSQMNLVTGLLGHAKLVSFYSPYRCTVCNTEFEKLVLVPGDSVGIRDLATSSKTCPNCGAGARLDKYPAAIASKIAERSTYDIDDEVVAFLRAQFKYNVALDTSRFRAYRRVAKGSTYLRLSGDLTTLPAETLASACEGNTVVDLAGALVSHDLAQWRVFEHLTGARPAISSVQLLDCPDGFLERAVQPDSLGGKLKIRTFTQSYYCTNCRVAMDRAIDVAENLESLIEALLPPTKCATCHSTVEIVPGHALAHVLRQLPARERDPDLDKFIAKARTEPPAKLEDVLAARATKRPTATTSGSRMIYVVSALAVLILAGIVIVGLGVWNREPVQQTQPVIVSNQPTADAGSKVFERPDWVLSDVPASAFCHDMINRWMCVGVSSYRPTRNEAVAEAKDAALEELAVTVGLKISNPAFQKEILPIYSSARAKALATLQTADTDRKSVAYAAALETVRNARKRAIEALEASGGPALPAQRSDWYWEEYAIDEKKGSAEGTEVLVFVRYDIGIDAMKALVERYSAVTPAGKSTAINAFPGLAWVNPEFTGGAMLQKVGRPFTEADFKPFSIVTSVGGQRVADVTALAKRLEEPTTGKLEVTVLDRDPEAKPRIIEVKR